MRLNRMITARPDGLIVGPDGAVYLQGAPVPLRLRGTLAAPVTTNLRVTWRHVWLVLWAWVRRRDVEIATRAGVEVEVDVVMSVTTSLRDEP